MFTRMLRPNAFFFSMMLLCLAYVGFEFCYASYMRLGPDDFWFSHASYQFKDYLPYRDFLPYKTVLGYYLLLITLQIGASLSVGPLAPLLFVKKSLAVVNAILFFCGAYALKRLFSSQAVIWAFLFVMLSVMVLMHSIDIRVDMFAYWCAFFSIISIFCSRYVLAGLLLGIGFAFSQKILWHWAAIGVALALVWIIFQRNKLFFAKIFYLNMSFLLMVLGYLLLWGSIAGFEKVLTSVFYEAFVLQKMDLYASMSVEYWQRSLAFNPVLFVLFPFTLITLIPFQRTVQYQYRVFIAVYTAIVFLEFVSYKQVFPYNFLVFVPAFLLVYSSFFDWLLAVFKRNYYLLAVMLMTVFAVGTLFPIVVLISNFMAGSNEYQQATLNAAYQLLEKDDTYIAGTDLFFDKNQVVSGLKQLDIPQLTYLHYPIEKYKPVASLSSLHHAALTPQQVLEEINQANVKFYINNHRIQLLPKEIKDYLKRNYKQVSGSLYLYAPALKNGENYIKFSGKYQIESARPVWINGVRYRNKETITLKKGLHQLKITSDGRISMLTNSGMVIKKDEWDKML